MKIVTKKVIAAGTVALIAVVGVATLASADHRGSWRGGDHHGYHGKGHHGKMGRHSRSRFKGHGMKHLLKRFDADNDGKLTQDELNKSRQDLLAKHDSDKDGKLSLKEFEQLWLEFMQKRVVRGFQRIDEDGDAQITAAEFLEPFANAVAKMDRNEDGVLDKNDKRRWKGRHHRGRDHYRNQGDKDKDDSKKDDTN